MDMPDPMQQRNRYRSTALGKYWAENGLAVIPTLSWAQPSSYTFCFKGIPKHSTVATSTIGVARDKDVQKVWHDGMREAMRRLEPSLGAAFSLLEKRWDMPITKPPGIESDPLQVHQMGRADARARVRAVRRARALPALPVVQDSRYRPGRAERRAQRQAGAEAAEGAAFSLVYN